MKEQIFLSHVESLECNLCNISTYNNPTPKASKRKIHQITLPNENPLALLALPIDMGWCSKNSPKIKLWKYLAQYALVLYTVFKIKPFSKTKVFFISLAVDIP